MINPLQSSIPLGTQNLVQQQAGMAQAASDIRTNNAEQLEKRSVEKAGGTEGKQVEDEKQAKEKGANPATDQKKGLVPPPPTRFELAMQAGQKQVQQTQQAITHFFLSAAANTSLGVVNPPKKEEGQAQASVNITV